MTTEEKLNALTRLVILISILMYVFKSKYSWVALIAGIAGIMFLYYMFVKKQQREGFYTEYPSPDVSTTPIHSDFPEAPMAPLHSQIVQGVSDDFAIPEVPIPQAYYNPTYYQVTNAPIYDQLIPAPIAPMTHMTYITPMMEPQLTQSAGQQVPHYQEGYDFKKLTPVGDHLHSLASFHTSQLNIQANHIQTKAIEGIIKHRNRFASQQNSAWGGVNVPTQV